MLTKTPFWNVALFAAETWTMTTGDNIKKIEAVEIWLWRRILGIN